MYVHNRETRTTIVSSSSAESYIPIGKFRDWAHSKTFLVFIQIFCSGATIFAFVPSGSVTSCVFTSWSNTTSNIQFAIFWISDVTSNGLFKYPLYLAHWKPSVQRLTALWKSNQYSQTEPDSWWWFFLRKNSYTIIFFEFTYTQNLFNSSINFPSSE